LNKRKFIGEQLRRARIPQTQEEAARGVRALSIHMTQRILSAIERGERDLTAEELDAFCRYLGKPHSFFLEMPEELREKKEEYVPKSAIDMTGLADDEIKLIEELVKKLHQKK